MQMMRFGGRGGITIVGGNLILSDRMRLSDYLDMIVQDVPAEIGTASSQLRLSDKVTIQQPGVTKSHLSLTDKSTHSTNSEIERMGANSHIHLSDSTVSSHDLKIASQLSLYDESTNNTNADITQRPGGSQITMRDKITGNNGQRFNSRLTLRDQVTFTVEMI